MRRRISRSLVFVVGLILALGMAPAMVAQDQEELPPVRTDDESVFLDGITPEAAGNDQAPATLFRLTEPAYFPERTTSPNETMIVKILSGTLAFRVQSPNVVVDPQGQQIHFVTSDPTIPFGENPDNFIPITYTDQGQIVSDWCVGPSENLCELNPDNFGDEQTFVRLDPGFTVYLPPNSTCFFCNVSSFFPSPEQTEQQDFGADVLVLASDEAIQFWQTGSADGTPVAAEQSTPAVQTSDLRVVRGWMLNPGTNCK